MPLDLGAVTQSSSAVGAAVNHFSGESAKSAASTIGGLLRAKRESRGLSLQDLADATRIRRSYLAALEDMKLGLLPSRPFTLGYVRSYAQALGMDPDQAVARFKIDAPINAEPLRAPIGVSRERDPRIKIAAGGAAVVLTAVLVWNLAQHATVQDKPVTPAVSDAAAAAPAARPAGHGPVVLTASQPAPIESNAPAPYVTPGLAAAEAAANGVVVEAAAAPAEPAVAASRPAFNTKAAIYGATAQQSVITLQARKPASLVVRGADGAVYFARQLAVGESYRAPLLKGLTVDVSDPAAFDVYANGELRGPLQTAQTAVARLAG